MRIELLNQSKYRHGSRPGDDVPLVVPGVVFGVFDGATDALGTMVNGVSAGRLAALTVAEAMAALVADPEVRCFDGEDIIDRLSAALHDRTAPFGLSIPPSTTLAAVLDCGTEWRFLILGDTGIRINGNEVLLHQKEIDTVSTEARVRIFRVLRTRFESGDETEHATRRAIMLGLDTTISENVFSTEEVRLLIKEVVIATNLQACASTVERFLRDGIKKQYEFGNGTGPLAFGTMNGTKVTLSDLIDETRPKSDVKSLEIFTDGYPAIPMEVSPEAWEEAFEDAERTDYHKTGDFATVKGSTENEFFDDRTILVLRDMLDGVQSS